MDAPRTCRTAHLFSVKALFSRVTWIGLFRLFGTRV
jgi:hypothetical protein